MTDWIILSLAVSVANATCLRWGILFLGEPLVVGALLGLWLGDMTHGLYLGGVFQFMWLKSIPVGVKVQTNYTVMTFLAVMLVHQFGERAYPLAFAAAYLFAFLAKQTESFLRRFDNLIADKVMKNIATTSLGLVKILYLAGYTAVFFLLVLAGLSLSGPMVELGQRLLPARLFEAFQFSYPYLVLYALSLFFQAVSLNAKIVYFALGAAAGLVLFVFKFGMLVNIGVLMVLAIGLAFLNRRLLGLPGRKNAA